MSEYDQTVSVETMKVEITSYWIMMGPTSKQSILVRDTEKTHRDTGELWQGRQRLDLHRHKPRNGRSWKKQEKIPQIPSRALRRILLQTPWYKTSGHLNGRQNKFLFFKVTPLLQTVYGSPRKLKQSYEMILVESEGFFYCYITHYALKGI